MLGAPLSHGILEVADVSEAPCSGDLQGVTLSVSLSVPRGSLGSTVTCHTRCPAACSVPLGVQTGSRGRATCHPALDPLASPLQVQSLRSGLSRELVGPDR